MLYLHWMKPFIDRIAALLLLLLISPIFLLVVVIMFRELRGNPFFVQGRPGLKGKIFKLIKLRTMTDCTDDNGQLLPDNQRLTPLGKKIRGLSLDELPQLINVLKGDMSFIGPRPLLVEYLEIYSAEENRRHDVKPGITGWAQVNGRNAISWKKKFELDLYYVDNAGLGLDCRVALLTISKVIKRDGVNQSEDVPMEKYNGRN